MRPEPFSAAAPQPVRTRRAYGAINVLFALVFTAFGVGAQSTDTTARGQDPVVARARQLAQGGSEADARKLLDSLIAVTPSDDPRFGEALYWHGAYAVTAADAERSFKRLLIEAPLSLRAEDGLLRLATLEQARGDRRSASDHLQRFLLTYPESPARSRVSVQLVRLLFDQGPQQLARACDVLHTARAEVPASAVELRNQLDAQAPRCAYVETAPAAPAAAPPTVADSAPPVAPVTTAAPPAPQPPVTSPAAAAPAVSSLPAAAPATAFYSVQLAAYDSQESAARMVQQLAERGIEARVDGASAPYRVRVGKYATRADAAKAAADLKTKGHSGFITLVGPAAK